MGMNLKQLRYFVRIADCGSVSRAAEILHVAQPSLSAQLRGLEENLGTPLFVRHYRGVTLTELGRRFYEQARLILNNVEYATDLARTQSHEPHGRVTVGLPTSVARGLALGLVKSVAAKHPAVSVQIVEAMTGNLDEWLQIGKLDVALLANPKAFENVLSTEVMAEDLTLIVGRNAPLARRKQVEFEKILKQPLVLPSNSHVIRIVLQACAARRGLKFDVAIDCDSLTGIVQLVKGGYCTIGPRFGVAEEIGRRQLVAVPIVKPTPRWELSVMRSERSINPRASEAVAGVLIAEMQSMVNAGLWPARLKGATGPSAGRRPPAF
jgi:DNA-binding transcriptional LysR family regulator